MLKTALAAICILVVLAVGYLTLSVIVLRPPRVNYSTWITVASVVLVLSGMTLAALTGVAALRGAVIAAGALLALLGGCLIQQTVTGAHFEGYALLLGSMLIAQGSLALITFMRARG